VAASEAAFSMMVGSGLRLPSRPSGLRMDQRREGVSGVAFEGAGGLGSGAVAGAASVVGLSAVEGSSEATVLVVPGLPEGGGSDVSVVFFPPASVEADLPRVLKKPGKMPMFKAGGAKVGDQGAANLNLLTSR
jgi:hypothetical protein